MNLSKKEEQEPSGESLLDDRQIIIVNNVDSPSADRDRYRTVLVCGDIDEEVSAQIMHNLLYFGSSSPMPDGQESSPIDFVISTCGGSAIEMFGIYDIMRDVRERAPVITCGVGKVMSAGVLLLAAGTKGKRKIGRNCRVMIHGVMGGYHGNLTNMENEIAEVKWVQERYIENLVEESFLSKKKIKNMLNKQVDVYLSAEQAVKYGIADIVI